MRKTAALLLALMLALASLPGLSAAEAPAAEAPAEAGAALASYEEARAALHGSLYDEAEMTEAEKTVDAALKAMKADADQYYTVGTGYGLVTAGNPQARESNLFAFCQSLPKGGDLHVHTVTALPLETLVNILLEEPDIHISLEEGAAYCTFYVPGPDLPETAVPLRQAMEDGRISMEEIRQAFSVAPGLTPRQAWDSFAPFFRKLSQVISSVDLSEKFYVASFRNCIENGITLLEVRLDFSPDEEANRAMLDTFKEAYFTVKKEYPDFTVRAIGCSKKRATVPMETIMESLRSAIRLSSEYMDDYDPDHVQPLIIGLDLVNEEDTGRPLSDYADFFLSEEVRSSGLKLFLHSGESLRADNDAVIDAFLFGAARLGHGFNLFRYPKVLSQLAESHVAVEVCPTSNCLLGYAHDLRLHPAAGYFRAGVPVVLCSDDALFLEESVLTEDYFAAILSWNLSLMEIKALTENSILYSGLPLDEINTLHANWETRWNAFIEEWSTRLSQENAA